jgi:methanethiol S-methyltransferase
MSYAADVIIILIAFALFGYSHSLLASGRLKKMAAARFGSLIAFYRLIYNFISLLILYIFFQVLPRPDLVIYDLSYPWDIVVLIPQFLSLAGIIWSARYFSLWEFAGISQIRRWAEGRYNTDDLDEALTFRAEGPYRISRHPVYFFAIIFLLSRPSMDLFYLTIFISLTAYFYVGSVYEERKLIERFGEEYLSYKEKVPRIFPLKAGRK